MKQKISHPWELTEVEAIDLQHKLSSYIEQEDRFGEINTVAGVDVGYDKFSNKIIAATVVLDTKTLNVIDYSVAEDIERFPYVPGLFSFRELPSIAKSLEKLDTTPDLIVCDGQGIAHPRRFGLACHLGVLFDIPTIGCGKSLLIGHYDFLPKKRGEMALLTDQHEVIGSALCTQDNIKPVYISTGHRISLDSACKEILKFTKKYRLPETTRHADQMVKKMLAVENIIK